MNNSNVGTAYLDVRSIVIGTLGQLIYPNNSRGVYLYIYWVSAYMG